MKCPNCGIENTPTSRYCRECGTPLSDNDCGARVDAGPEMPGAVTDKAAGSGPALPRASALTKRRLGIAAIVAMAAIVAVLAVSLMPSSSGPSDSVVEEAVMGMDFGEGSALFDYGAGGDYEVESVEVLDKAKVESSEYAEGRYGQSEYWAVTVEVAASNGTARASRACQIDFFEVGDVWVYEGSLASDSTTYEAVAGVDQGKVMDNVLNIAYAAGYDLSAIYSTEDATFESEELDADAGTDVITISLASETEFTSSSGTISVTFEFMDGIWSPSSVEASDGIDDLSYQKLVGTWVGTFQRQTSTASNKCYGAEGQELTIAIESVSDTSLKAEGTFSAVVHYHEQSESDEDSNDGDAYLEGQAFTITLDGTGYSSYFADLTGDLYGRCELGETADGSLTLVICFDPETGDADAALMTVPNATDSWRSYAYIDWYALTKSEQAGA